MTETHPAPPLLRVGVDTGGTFTDCVLWDERAGRVTVVKVPSQPNQPEAAVADGIAQLAAASGADPRDVRFVAHGTTVATNAVITGELATVGMITNRGFRDAIEIGSQQRPLLYPLHQRPRTSLVRRDRRLEVAGRVDPDGEILEELDEAEIEAVARALGALQVDAVAIAMLFSFANPVQEQRVQEIVERVLPNVYVTRSSAVSPEVREYPRFATTAVNAALAPLLDRYIRAIGTTLRKGRYGAPLHVMQSNGGVATAERSTQANAHRLVLSGPAAGVIGGAYVGQASGFRDVVTLDIGGTSADIGIAVDGHPRMRSSLIVGDGIPLQIPAIEVEAIGAGGGSIATIDAGGSLRVGPHSAGAAPGPACYGAGGDEPTLTDAHLVLGRLGTEDPLAGQVHLRADLARDAIRRIAEPLGLSVEEAAVGIVAVAEANMTGAIRQTAARHGDDLRDFVLVAAGGAGPLHGVRLAAELGMRGVCVPLAPGLLSAIGLLSTDLRHDLAAPLMAFLADLTAVRIDDAFERLEREAHDLLEAERIPVEDRRLARSMDLRAVGQEWTLTVPVEPRDEPTAVAVRFHEVHERVYGHSAPDEPVESVTIRVAAAGRLARPRIAPGPPDAVPVRERSVWFQEAAGFLPTRVLSRSSLAPDATVPGPAVITQLDTTVLVPPGYVARAGAMGNLVIRAESAGG